MSIIIAVTTRTAAIHVPPVTRKRDFDGAIVIFAVMPGSGLVAMPDDTDVGNLVTAVRSAARRGHALPPPLIPASFVVRELIAWLGLITGRRMGTSIKERLGETPAWISFGGMVRPGSGRWSPRFGRRGGRRPVPGAAPDEPENAGAAVIGADQERGGSGGCRPWQAYSSWRCSFWRGGRIRTRLECLRRIVRLPPELEEFRVPVAVNIGAVIMSRMIFCRQSALAEERDGCDPRHERCDTLTGAIGELAAMMSLAPAWKFATFRGAVVVVDVGAGSEAVLRHRTPRRG